MDRRSDRGNAGQVSKVSRGVERRLEKKGENQVQNKSVKKALQLMKRALQLLNEGDTTRTINGPKIKRPFQRPLPKVTCNFCHKPGHFKRDCRMANGLCLACGKEGHVIRNCQFRRVGNMAPVRPAHLAPAFPAPPPRRNPGPVDRRAPIPPQQNDQQQRGVKTGADQSRAEASDSAAEREDQCPDPEP